MPLLQQSGPHQSIAVLNTEQFFFDSLRRHPGGRYDYEGCIMPSVPAMKHARSHFLSAAGGARSEEHTSELQSLMRISYAVFCLKKKIHSNTNTRNRQKH